MEPFELTLSQVNFEGNDLASDSSSQTLHSFSNIVCYDSDFKGSSSGAPIAAQRVKKSDRNDLHGFLLPETSDSRYLYRYDGEPHVQMHLVNGHDSVIVDSEQIKHSYAMNMEKKSQSSVTSTPERKSTDSGPDSFRGFTETVEALALQKSVIGNSTVTPASAEEVARVIAMTQMKMKAGETDSDSTHSTLSLSVSDRTNHTDVTDLSAEGMTAGPGAGSQHSLTSSYNTVSFENSVVTRSPSAHASTTSSADLITLVHSTGNNNSHQGSWPPHQGTEEPPQNVEIEEIRTVTLENSSSYTGTGHISHQHQQHHNHHHHHHHITTSVAMESGTSLNNNSISESEETDRASDDTNTAEHTTRGQHQLDTSNMSSTSSSSDLIPVPQDMITKVTERTGWLGGRSVVTQERSRPGNKQPPAPPSVQTEQEVLLSKENTLVKTVSSTAEEETLIHSVQTSPPPLHMTSASGLTDKPTVHNLEPSKTVISTSNSKTFSDNQTQNGEEDGSSYERNTSNQNEVNDVAKLKGEYDFDTNSYLQTMQTFTSLHGRNNGSLSEEGGAARFSPPVKDPGMQPSRHGNKNKAVNYEDETLKVESSVNVIDAMSSDSDLLHTGGGDTSVGGEWGSSDRRANSSYLPLHLPHTSTPVKGSNGAASGGDHNNHSVVEAHAMVASNAIQSTVQSTVQSSSVRSSLVKISKSESVVSQNTSSTSLQNSTTEGIDQDITDTKYKRSFQRNVSHNVSHSSQSTTEISKTSMIVNLDESGRQRSPADDMTGDLSLGNSSAAAGEGADLSRSERNEFYSLQEEVVKLRREKAHLEGKVEILEGEATVAIKERSELQSHLAAVATQLKSNEKNHKTVVGDKNALSADLETLKQNRQRLELVVMDAQKLIEEKDHDLKTLSEDLKLAHAANEKQQDKMKDLRREMLGKDETIQALKNKVAELYVEYQTSHQSRILAENEVKSLQSDVQGLQNAKEWYQSQLGQAQETKTKLQRDITQIQRENIASLTLVERLKADNVRSKQALAEQQQRALQEKEQLAKHLERIEADMMEREAAFSLIQQERVAVEEAMRQEEERLRQTEVDSSNSEDLKKLQNDLRRKQAQVNVLEHEQTQLIKRLTLAQESLLERDRTIDNLDRKYVDVEVSYKHIQKELELRDEEVLKLKNEKNALDVELESLKEEKKSFDVSLHTIKGDMGKVEHSFKQMKVELAGRTDELQDAKSDNTNLNNQLAAARARLRVLTQRASPKHQAGEVVEMVQRQQASPQQQGALPYDMAPVHKEAKDGGGEALVVKIVEKQLGSGDSKPEVVILTEETVTGPVNGDQPPIADMDNAVIAELQTQRDALEAQVQQLTAHNIEQEERIKSLGQQFERDIAVMKERLAEALTLHQQMKADKREAESEVVKGKERLLELEISLRTLTEEKERLEALLEEERSQQAVQVQCDEVEEREAITQLGKENSMLRSKLLETEKKLRSDVNKLKAKVLEVTEEYEARLDEERHRQVDYQAALTELNQRLRDAETTKSLLAQELQATQDKFNLSMDEQKEQVQREQTVLQTERRLLEEYKTRVTVEMEEVRCSLLLKEETIEILRTKIMEVEVQYREAREQLDESERLRQEEDARRLSLDLEREKGRLAGVMQSHSALKEHTTSLEAALARREASVAGLSTHVQGELQKRDKLIHELKEQLKEQEAATGKEKQNVKEAKKQLMTEKGQHIKLRRQMETLWVEQDQVKVDLQTRTNDVNMTTLELEKVKHVNMTLKADVERLSIECQTSRRDVEQLKRDLLERERVDPVLREQIQTLEWQLQQKTDELDALREQLKIVDERQSVEVSSLNKTLQATTMELNSLKSEMHSFRQEKLSLTTKIAQLKSALKASVTHTKKRREQKEAELTKTLPPPFDMAAMERLLQDTAPVEVQSKPLSFLKATLSGLRGEISNLQHQVDEHTNTVQTSSEAWRELEHHVRELREVCKTSAAGRAASQVTIATATTEHVTTHVEVHDNDLLDPEHARTPIVDL